MPPPLLLIKSAGSSELVMRCCPQARSRGITPGTPLAQARSILPAAVVRRFDRFAAEHKLRQLAGWAMRFTPLVEIRHAASEESHVSAGAAVLLDIQGAAHLFGGSRSMLARLHRALKNNGLTCRLAAAPSLGAAYALARFSGRPASHVVLSELPAALYPLSVEALRIDAALTAALAEIGLTTIADSPSSSHCRRTDNRGWPASTA